MTAYKKTVITYDPTVKISEKIPTVEVKGHTFINIRKGNNAVAIYGDTRKQTINCAKGLVGLLQCAISDLEEKNDD